MSAQISKDLVGSLTRGLHVVEILASHPSGLTLSETAHKTGLTRAGARRILLTLVASGYAVQDLRRFYLSARLLTLARTWLQNTSLWTFAQAPMRSVSEKFGEACSAAVLAEHDVVYVARVPGRHILSVALHVGTRLPAYCTSMGRVLLSGLRPADLDIFLAGADLKARTNRTVTQPAALVRLLEQTRRDGFAIVDQELEIGLRSIAVPVRDCTGKTVAAVNVSTQAARLSCAQLKREVLPMLQQASHEIEQFFVVQ